MTNANRSALKSLRSIETLIAAEQAEMAQATEPGQVLACRNAIRDLETRRAYLASQVG